MTVVKIEPTSDYPVPFSIDAEEPTTFVEALEVAANTAELLTDLGAPVEVAPEDAVREKQLIDAVLKNQKTKPLNRLPTAIAASAFLKIYGQNLAFDANQARAAITSKLMEIANCGDIKYELKALELLGKHSDIGLFTERSEITINYKNPEDLENAIKERVKRLLNADIIDVTPIGMNLDEELGVIAPPPAPDTPLIDALYEDGPEEGGNTEEEGENTEEEGQNGH